jgi:hypothetical protein
MSPPVIKKRDTHTSGDERKKERMVFFFCMIFCLGGIVWLFLRYWRGPRLARSFPDLSPVLREQKIALRQKVANILQRRQEEKFIYGSTTLFYGDKFCETGVYTGQVDMWLFHEVLREYMIPRLFLVRSLHLDNDDVDDYVARIFYRLFQFMPIKKDHFVHGNKEGKLMQSPMFMEKGL